MQRARVQKMPASRPGKAYAVRYKPVGCSYRKTLRVSDRRDVAQKFADKVNKLLDAQLSEQAPDPSFVRWLNDALDDSQRKTLVEWGVVPASLLDSRKPLDSLIDDWAESMRTAERPVKERTIDLLLVRLRRVVDECGFARVSDFNADTINSRLATWGLAEMTKRHFRAACLQFCRWAESRGLVSRCPLPDRFGRMPQREMCRHILTTDEQLSLIAATASGPTEQGRTKSGALRWTMTGPERALLYSLALSTGLRNSAIRSLTRVSFRLDSERPTVTLSGKQTKNGKPFVAKLPPALAARLESHLQHKLPDAPAFAPARRDELARLLRKDAKRARQGWIDAAKDDPKEHRRRLEDRDYLVRHDSQGRQLDFHSLRGSYATTLDSLGVSGKMLTTLVRHASIDTSYRHYVSPAESEGDKAIDRLGGLLFGDDDETLRATGTTGSEEPTRNPPRNPSEPTKNPSRGATVRQEPSKNGHRRKADRVGFEPTVERIALRRFSKPVPSAARPPVRRGGHSCRCPGAGQRPGWNGWASRFSRRPSSPTTWLLPLRPPESTATAAAVAGFAR